MKRGRSSPSMEHGVRGQGVKYKRLRIGVPGIGILEVG